VGKKKLATQTRTWSREKKKKKRRKKLIDFIFET